MGQDDEIRSRISGFFRALTQQEQDFISTLPEEFRMECPYFEQQEMHWSGAACAQMLHAFYSDQVPSQEDVARSIPLFDWKMVNHETLEDDFTAYMAHRNFIPNIYFPAIFARPHFPSSIEAGDFMYTHAEIFHERDLLYMKSLLVKTMSPIFIRIHFSTDEYPMPEEMAEKLDAVGHGVLVLGYNAQGLLVHDPWSRQKWNGSRGGPYSILDYETAGAPGRYVNGTYDFVGSYTKLRSVFLLPDRVPLPDREIHVNVRIRNVGIRGIASDFYSLKSIAGILHSDRGLEVLNPVSHSPADPLYPGDETILSWPVRAGSKAGSFPLRADIHASIDLPVRPWERNRINPERLTIRASVSGRLDIKAPKWFVNYADVKS